MDEEYKMEDTMISLTIQEKDLELIISADMKCS